MERWFDDRGHIPNTELNQGISTLMDAYPDWYDRSVEKYGIEATKSFIDAYTAQYNIEDWNDLRDESEKKDRGFYLVASGLARLYYDITKKPGSNQENS